MTRTAVADLNAVIAIATHKSFRTAAAELAISPSALSHAIAALERRIGVRLFHRTTRSVAVTEAGSELIARVRPALREITDAMTEVAERRDAPSGTLRLNSSAGAARMIVMPIVLEFVARHPNVHVDLVTNDRLIDIVADGFDAGVRSADGVPRDMVAVPCSSDVRFAVVGSPAYFARRARPLRPADLAGHACVRTRYSSGVLYRWDFEKRGKQIAFEPAGPLTLDDYPLMIEAALAGVALAYVSQ